MSRRLPAYCLHKPTGRAYVRLSGRQIYLGAYNDPDSRRAYDRLIAEWLGSSRTPPIEASIDLTTGEVLAAYWAYAEARYSDYRTLDRIRRSLSIVRQLYGDAPARSFRGKALKACRAAMVAGGSLCRRTINQRVDCIKRCYRWALAEEIVPAEVVQSLLAVPGLRRGEAAEGRTVRPVDPESVERTLARLSPTVADMVRVQLASGTRPGEVCAIRSDEIEFVCGDLWVWRPAQHKTAHRGHGRQVFLGPRAVEVLGRYLERVCPRCGSLGTAEALAWRGTTCGPCADCLEESGLAGPWPWVAAPGKYLFSPAEETARRRAEQRAARQTPVQPSQVCRASARPRKTPGERYTTQSYGRAISTACKAAGVPPWHPHQLRHAAATAIAQQFGWEAARVYLGHRSLDVTRIYAEDDLERAAQVARAIG